MSTHMMTELRLWPELDDILPKIRTGRYCQADSLARQNYLIFHRTWISSKENRSPTLCGKCPEETKKIQTMTKEKTIFIQFQRNSNSFEGKLISSTKAANLFNVSKKRCRETFDMSHCNRIKRECQGIDDMLSFLVKDRTIKHKKTNVVIAQHKGHDTRRIYSINCNNVANRNNRCDTMNRWLKQTEMI